MNFKKKHAIIVGAGVSGMQVASSLESFGFEVTIFEAKSRYGGRIHSNYDFADFPIELGGEEIHGENSPHFKIAKNNNIKLINENELTHYIEVDGKLKEADKIKNDSEFKRALKVYNEIYNYKSSQDTDFLNYLNNTNTSDRAWHVFEGIVAREWGTSMDKLSMRGMAIFEDSFNHGGTNFLMKNSSQINLFEAAFKNIIDKINLNTPITKIDYNEEP